MVILAYRTTPYDVEVGTRALSWQQRTPGETIVTDWSSQNKVGQEQLLLVYSARFFLTGESTLLYSCLPTTRTPYE